MSSPSRPDALFDLVHQVLADRERGAEQPLASYLARHPDAEGSLLDFALEGLLQRNGPASPTSGPNEASDAEATLAGRYRVIRELGRGGQGTVALAVDERLGRRVAIKLLTSIQGLSSEAEARFQREAMALAKIDHPGLCPIFDHGRHQGTPFIVMKFVAGQPLSVAISAAKAAGAPLPSLRPNVPGSTAEILHFFAEAASAMHAAHTAHLLHRDLKPQNIMVTPDGQPVILDFGLARSLESSEPSLTRTGDWFGTPAYMPPEHFRSSGRDLLPASDVFSLGVALFEALTLERPFAGATPAALERAITEWSVRDRLRRVRRLPPLVATVLEVALDKDSAHRYRSMEAFAEDLRRAAQNEPLVARPPSLARRLRLWIRRRPMAATLLGTLLALLPVIGFLGYRQWRDRPQVLAAERAANRREYDRLVFRGFTSINQARDPSDTGDLEAALRIPGIDRPIEAIFGLAIAAIDRGDGAACEAILDRHAAAIQGTRAEAILRTSARATRTRATTKNDQLPPAREPMDFIVESIVRLERGLATGKSAEIIQAGNLALEACLTSPERNPLAHRLLAVTAGHTRNPDFTRLVVKTLVAHDPKDAALLVQASYCCAQVDLFAEAASYAKAATELDPTSGEAWTNLGGALYRGGQKEEGKSNLRRATEVAPNRAEAWQNLGSILLHEGATSEAIDYLKRACALDPRAAVSATELLRAFDAAGKPRAAFEFQIASDAKLSQSVPWSYLSARTHRLMGRLESAATLYERTLRLDPNHAEAHCDFGNLQLRLGNLAEAKRLLERGHELGSARSNWKPPSATWLERATSAPARIEELKIQADAALPPAERAALAAEALGRGHPALALRLLGELANAESPGAATIKSRRFLASQVLQDLGLGRGADCPAEGPEIRRSHRDRALTLLTEELEELEARASEKPEHEERIGAALKEASSAHPQPLLLAPGGHPALDSRELAAWTELQARFDRLRGSLER